VMCIFSGNKVTVAQYISKLHLLSQAQPDSQKI